MSRETGIRMDVTTTIIVAALIVAGSSTITALLLQRQNDHNRRNDREDDHRRADAIASRQADHARLLLETNERMSRRTSETGEVLEGKLNVIHGLVNSAMTAAKQSEHDAIERTVALMKEVSALHKAMGNPPSQAAEQALAQTNHRLDELGAELADRRAQDELSRQQTEQATSLAARRRSDTTEADREAAAVRDTQDESYKPIGAPPTLPRPGSEVRERFERE